MLATVAVEEVEATTEEVLVELTEVEVEALAHQAVVAQTLEVAVAVAVEMATTKLGLEVLAEVLE